MEGALVFVFGVECFLLECLLIVVVVETILRAVTALDGHKAGAVGQGVGVFGGLHT